MKNIILFGSGYMAGEYIKVLKALGCKVTVIARDELKVKKFASEYGYEGIGGGIKALKKVDINKIDWVINAGSICSLAEINMACLDAGIDRILVEKPGAISLNELEKVSALAGGMNNIRIAFNRRYYNSVNKLLEKIRKDDGAIGCFFDFTDREKDVLEERPKEVQEKWGWCNAMHVIDLSFFLVGGPEELTVLKDGSLKTHPSGSIYTGCGKTKQCLFSYFATWSGGGRWNIEVSTKEGRYKLSPLETLAFCRKNQFSWENVDLDDTDDDKYKPGLYKMVRSVVFKNDLSKLPTIKEQIEKYKLAKRIFGYEN